MSHKSTAPVLTREECAELSFVATAPTTPSRIRLRANAVLMAASAISHSEIAKRLGVSRRFVVGWCGKFSSAAGDRVAVLLPERRQNPVHDRIIAKALHEIPRTAAIWTTSSMAREAGTSRATVSRVWRKQGIRSAGIGIYAGPLCLPDGVAERVTGVAGVFYRSDVHAVAFVTAPRPTAPSSKPAALPTKSLSHDISRLGTTLSLLQQRIVLVRSDPYEQFHLFLNALVKTHPTNNLYVATDAWDISPDQVSSIQQLLASHANLHLCPTPLLVGTLGAWEAWVNVWLARSTFASGSNTITVVAGALEAALAEVKDVLTPISFVLSAEGVPTRVPVGVHPVQTILPSHAGLLQRLSASRTKGV